jgi:pyridoxal phosphate enzyme (YggS family)
MDGKADGTVKDRLACVFDRIRRAIQEAGRKEGEVRLVAASKSVTVDRIKEALDAGVRIAGENRLQEALPKIEALKEERITWHFIGQLQRRKVRAVVGIFDLIHSVDSVELAAEIDRCAEAAGLRQKILIEINLGAEPGKAGFLEDRVEEAFPRLAALNHLAIEGLMVIPPLVREAEQSRPYFRRLRKLGERLRQWGSPGVSVTEFSMGMSNDYVVAIHEGATLIRLGTAIFGGRRG